MRASEFVRDFAPKGLRKWEAEALDMIAKGQIAQPAFIEVPVRTPDGAHEGRFFAAGDYLSVGEGGDYMRMPLTPRSAQLVADLFSVQLPTSKMVDAIWAASEVKLDPQPENPNRFVNLPQMLDHSRKVDAQLAQRAGGRAFRGLAGQKKDVVISRNMPPGKVVIYGWHRPDGTHIQPRSSIHAEDYLDYSHGIRLVSPNMVVDGKDVLVVDVLKDPALSALLSDEGPITRPRYGREPELSYQAMLARLRGLV